MNLTKYLYPYWGSEHYILNEFLDLVISNGFDGIEINLPLDGAFRKSFDAALTTLRRENPNFICVLQQVSDVKKETSQEYLANVLKNLEDMVQYHPSFINSHTGKDHYSFSDNCRIIDGIEEFSIQHNIPVYHEIHRGRFTFHSISTLQYLDVFPDLKFVGDFSHWCVVSESMLQDQEDVINKIIPKIHHIHARVGFEQSPQVNNPFASEWDAYLNQFTTWWQSIIDHHKSQRAMTITPEFGPYPYMPQAPFTKSPMANQQELNIKMKNYLKLHLT